MNSLLRVWIGGLIASLWLGCGHVPKAVWKNFPSVYDTHPEAVVKSVKEPCVFPEAQTLLPEPSAWMWTSRKKLPRYAAEMFHQTGTRAFAMVRGDSLMYEYYGKKSERTTRFNSHSIAKAVVGTLVGIALKEGKIRSLDQPVTDYLPELKGRVSPELKVGDLLQMTSGLNFSEWYLNPFSSVTRMYYGKNTMRYMKRIRQRKPPGQAFAYRSSNTWLLARVLEKATRMTISEYTQAKLWTPLCVPADAGWKTDMKKNGVALGFDGFNTTAIGLARLGQLYANGGVWNGHRLLPPNWTASLLRTDTTRGAAPFYRHGWFTDAYYKDYFAEGLFYQYLYCNPETRTVMVRIGRGAGDRYDWRMTFRVLAGVQSRPTPQIFDNGEKFNVSGIYQFGNRADGDTTLSGRRVRIKGKEDYLVVKVLKDPKSIRKQTQGYQTDKRFRIYKESAGRFYEPKTYRTLEFSSDQERITWNRKENSWELKRLRRL